MFGQLRGTDLRSTILNIVEDHGAIHKSELCRLVGRAWGTVGYHLKWLNDAGLIETGKNDGLLWIYPPDLTRKQRKRARALAKENAQKIRDAVEKHARITVNELADRLDMPAGVIRRHLSRLTDAGVLEREGLRPQKFKVVNRRRDE